MGDCPGVCLAEVMIALAAGAVVLTAAFQALEHFQQRLSRQIQLLDRQQELRIGVKILTDELRLAGTGGPPLSPPLSTAAPQEAEFLANLDGLITRLVEPASVGTQRLVVENGADWPDGKQVLLCERERCSKARLSRTGQPHSLTLVSPLSQPFETGSPVLVSNAVRYYLAKNQEGLISLMRQVDGGANPVILSMSFFRLRYADRDGSWTDDPSRVARVRIEMIAVDGRNFTTEVALRGGT
jgi:hypothetical protein